MPKIKKMRRFTDKHGLTHYSPKRNRCPYPVNPARRS